MSEINSYIVKSVEEIKSDVKNIYVRLETITKDLHGYNNQKYKCQSSCDSRYLRLIDSQILFKQELEKYHIEKSKTAHRKTEIIKNIVQILIAVAPYLAIIGTYFVLVQN
jgi:hypothetical protein